MADQGRLLPLVTGRLWLILLKKSVLAGHHI